ncbi:hypothetical protein [Streptomyces cinnamoneus]|uniref:Cinorf9 protein n=1 Tax=Streptomyces cinnamoneus TaxID=53446 RepID=Q83VY0_STRCJ|nr:hypothetical protein [Streptomyces cinnamoneus]GHC33653.1 hypothetical protein GCM10010507_02700 [Streptomyces cinnamoneus]CAD60528.1 Cinorf9 protein [Streptomyces cinnamoneus]
MRKSLAVAAASAVAGLTLMAGTPANAAPAAATTVPSCVTSTFSTPFFAMVRVDMENKCTTEQRVKPSFNYELKDVPCYALQPGQKAVFSRDVIFASGYTFAGLVSC